jgi:hypothetical protein
MCRRRQFAPTRTPSGDRDLAAHPQLFVGATSHAPWAQVPPFVADWQIGPESFHGEPARVRPLTYASLPHDPELVPAYRESIACALRAAFGFVERLERPSLVFVLGDHQPPLGRTFVEAEARRDVPLHVISNRAELLEPYRRAGFTGGTSRAAARRGGAADPAQWVALRAAGRLAPA